MNLSCSVIRDLLPLYAEDLTSDESADLVREHLANCSACRNYLDSIQQPIEPIPESAEPIKQIRKELIKRRWRTAAIAALSVFLVLFALFAHAVNEKPLSYSPELLSVEGIVSYDPASEPEFSGAVESFQPEGWQTANPGQALVIARNERVSGVSSEFYLDDETGELTVYIQYFSTQAALMFDDVNGGFSIDFSENSTPRDVFYPVPDRVVYGFGQKQVLLWGEPMNGGVQILPRLALAYYLLIAAVLAVIMAILWLVFRRKSFSPVVLQLCFIPISYLLGHLCIKGTKTLSVFFMRDLSMICIEAAALYVLLTLGRRAWIQHKKDK